MFILYMACKSQARKEDEDEDEGFEDLSSSALHQIHYGHMNEGFEDESTRADDDLEPVCQNIKSIKLAFDMLTYTLSRPTFVFLVLL